MTTIRNCIQCRHIQHTSPTQIVWRCKWHCETKGGEKWRCHVLPEEPACSHFTAREVEIGADGIAAADGREPVLVPA